MQFNRNVHISMASAFFLLLGCEPLSLAVDQESRQKWNQNIKEIDKIYGRTVQPGLYRGPYGPRTCYPQRGGAFVLDKSTSEETEFKIELNRLKPGKTSNQGEKKPNADQNYEHIEKMRKDSRKIVENNVRKNIDKAYLRSINELDLLWKSYLDKNKIVRNRVVEEHVLPPELVDNLIKKWKPGMKIKLDEDIFLVGKYPQLVSRVQFAGEANSVELSNRIQQYSKTCKLNSMKKRLLLNVLIEDLHDLISSYLNYRATYITADDLKSMSSVKQAYQNNLREYRLKLSVLSGDEVMDEIDVKLDKILREYSQALQKQLEKNDSASDEKVGSPANW